MRIPLLTAQLNVFVDGGTKELGLSEVTYPNLAALAETITGAGIMGEIEIPSRGHFSAMEFLMNFRAMLDNPLNYAVGKTYNFDCRTAQSFEDSTTYQRGDAKERLSVIGPIKSITPGKRAPNATWDASIAVAVRRLELFVDGKQIWEWDAYNYIYKVNGVDQYAEIRAAIS